MTWTNTQLNIVNMNWKHANASENVFPRGFGLNKEVSPAPYLFSNILSDGWSAAARDCDRNSLF